MTKHKHLLITTFALGVNSAGAIEPAEVDYEGVLITPSIEISGTHDDNYLAIDDEKSSDIISITPNVKIAIPGEYYLYKFNYTLDHQIYTASGAKDLTNHFFDASANYELDLRNILSLTGEITKTEIAANAFTAGELNAFTKKQVGAGYTYGAPTASGNLEFGIARGSNLSDNGVNLDQDRDFTTYTAAFIYRATDKTRLTVEVNGADYDYLNNDGLDSSNLAYLLGARWEATAKTTGFFKIGKETKFFDDNNKDDSDLTSWELSMDWSPKTYSVFTIKTNQRIDEGLYGADYTEARKSSIQWKHDWGRGYNSKATFANIIDDYSSGRLDTTNAYTLGLNYEVRRWIEVGLTYQHSNRDSNENENDYTRNIYQISLNMSL